MDHSAKAIPVQIRRFVSDDNPGWVECFFVDALGREKVFIGKYPWFTTETLDAESRYPQPGVIACDILERQVDESGRERLLVDTAGPLDIESVDGETTFRVRPGDLMDIESPA